MIDAPGAFRLDRPLCMAFAPPICLFEAASQFRSVHGRRRIGGVAHTYDNGSFGDLPFHQIRVVETTDNSSHCWVEMGNVSCDLTIADESRHIKVWVVTSDVLENLATNIAGGPGPDGEAN